MIEKKLETTLLNILQQSKQITVLTGAGISAESGVPTFRGSEGYWTVGSTHYQPQEIATYRMLRSKPQEVWKWFLYRRGVCQQSKPNPGHLALVEMEQLLKDKFILLTQNVDGLHLRAGNTLKRTYQIHGNLDYMRCSLACSKDIYPIPKSIPFIGRDETLSDDKWALLKCPKCDKATRPHVLLWDESYDELYYRLQSSLEIAAKTDLLITVGTTGSTNLPNLVVERTLRNGGLLLDINIQENRFSQTALVNGGYFLQYPSGTALPEIVKILHSLKTADRRPPTTD